MKKTFLKGVFAKIERGYRHTAKNNRFLSFLILLLSVTIKRRILLQTTYTKERSVHTKSKSCNIRVKNQFDFKQIIVLTRNTSKGRL